LRSYYRRKRFEAQMMAVELAKILYPPKKGKGRSKGTTGSAHYGTTKVAPAKFMNFLANPHQTEV
jgi:hypothetical protein